MYKLAPRTLSHHVYIGLFWPVLHISLIFIPHILRCYIDLFRKYTCICTFAVLVCIYLPLSRLLSLGHSCTWLIWYFCLSLPLYTLGLCDQTVNYSIFFSVLRFLSTRCIYVSLSNWLTIDGGCHMTVFEICVKVPYMYTWGLNFHPFFGYPEVTNQHR